MLLRKVILFWNFCWSVLDSVMLFYAKNHHREFPFVNKPRRHEIVCFLNYPDCSGWIENCINWYCR